MSPEEREASERAATTVGPSASPTVSESGHSSAHRHGGLAVMPTKALAIRKPCLSHRWDLSRLACVACGARIYVEVRIS
jgi:hypothetical protein